MILLIDNYDSFTFNLRRYLRQLGQDVAVVRNDDPRLVGDLSQDYAALVLSPGPKTPRDAGHCLSLVRQWSGRLPILGVCLGHQVIFEAFGGQVVRAQRPVHGKSTPMRLMPSRLFDSIADGTAFARYHSLVASEVSLPDWLSITAWSQIDNEVMAVEHKEHPTFGVQFHPESILSLAGHIVLRNFLLCAGVPSIHPLPKLDLDEVSQVDLPKPPMQPMDHRQPVFLPRAKGPPSTP